MEKTLQKATCTDALQRLVQAFSLDNVKTSDQQKKNWSAPQKWSEVFQLKNIAAVKLGKTTLAQIDLFFRDQNLYQRRKRVFFEFNPAYLQQLSFDDAQVVVEKTSDKTIFSQTFWLLWFGLLKLSIPASVSLFKQKVGIQSSLPQLVQFCAQNKKQQPNTDEQNQMAELLLTKFKIIPTVAQNERKKNWATPRYWKQAYVLTGIGQILSQETKSSVRIQFFDENKITRSRCVRFLRQADYLEGQPFEEVLQKVKAIKGKCLFTHVFWEILIQFIQPDLIRARTRIKHRLGLRVNEGELALLTQHQEKEVAFEQSSISDEVEIEHENSGEQQMEQENEEDQLESVSLQSSQVRQIKQAVRAISKKS